MSKKVRWILFAFLLLVALYFVTGEVVSRCIGMDGKIDFYGKVIDPDGNPVGNARITYLKVTAFHLLPFSRSTHGPKREVKSDSRGLFHIKGGRGMSLQIEAIKKDGFRLAKGNSLNYGYGSNSDPHRPDPSRPIEFMLISLDNIRLKALSEESLRLKWDSAVTEVPFGDGEILLIKATRDKRVNERRGFAWNVEIEVKDGGVLFKEKGDRLPLAPVDGYQKFIKFGSERGSPKWTGGMTDGRLIFKTSKGFYGIIKIDLFVTQDDSESSGSVDFFLNPTGGRFLD